MYETYIYIYIHPFNLPRIHLALSFCNLPAAYTHTALAPFFPLYFSRISTHYLSLSLSLRRREKIRAALHTHTRTHTHTNTLCALGLLKCACVFLSRGERFFYSCANKRRLESGEFVLLGGTREVGHCNFMPR